jgi:hypothetical protein
MSERLTPELREDKYRMGLTGPFADRFDKFIEDSKGAVQPLQGRIDADEYKTVYNSLMQSDPDLAAEMGNVHESPFTRGNAALLHYPTDDQWALKNAPRYGLRLRPGFNNIVEPAGLRHKNRPTDFSTMSSDQIRSHLMETIEGAVQSNTDDGRNPEVGSLDAPLLADQSPTPQIDPTVFNDPDRAKTSWNEVVDWWLSHNFNEDLPSGGGLMIGPQEIAKTGNFLKDALLPLMAGDVGLAGVAGLGRTTPLPIPAGKIAGKGVDAAKGAWRAIRGFDSLADDAVIHVFHGTTAESAAAIRETGVAGRRSASRSEEVGIYVAPTRETAEMYAGVDGEVLEFTVRKRDLVSRPFDDPALEEALSGEQFYEPLIGGFLPPGTQVEVVGDVLAAGVARETTEAARRAVKEFVGDARLAPTFDLGKGVKVSNIGGHGIQGTLSTNRAFVIVQKADGSFQPFYQSTGLNSGMSGTWLPFDGYGGASDKWWLRKDPFTRGEFGKGTPLHRFGSEENREISDLLGERFKEIDSADMRDPEVVSFVTEGYDTNNFSGISPEEMNRALGVDSQ